MNPNPQVEVEALPRSTHRVWRGRWRWSHRTRVRGLWCSGARAAIPGLLDGLHGGDPAALVMVVVRADERGVYECGAAVVLSPDDDMDQMDAIYGAREALAYAEDAALDRLSQETCVCWPQPPGPPLRNPACPLHGDESK